jgi:site-specific DNA recombinase
MSELRKMRAAGYARVSTDTELQDGSYETQVQYFRDMIMEDPNLEFVDVYGDKGISGRDAERRPGFLQMIQDCKDGKIDVIYTKSVSRFARSLADLVEVVTDLRKIGVTIYFEEQGLNTMERQTDLYMNILGAIAEEESRSIGENVRMGLEARVLTGHPVGRVAYGYRRIDKDANWAICEEEAKRIRLAFRMAAAGECYQDIRKALDRMEEEAGTGIAWNKERLRRTFNNVVYKGDVLTGKTYTVRGAKKRVKINRGERRQVILEQHHEPIVTPELFDRVQSLMELGLLHSYRCRMEPSERAFLQDESWRVAQDRLERKQTGQAETIVIQGGYGNGSK